MNPFNRQQDEEENLTAEEGAHWVAVSDLMAGLMMVFLLVAVAYMVILERETQKIKEVALLYRELREQLYHDLYNEFKDDLPRWGAELKQDDLSLQFYNTDVMFDLGKSSLQPEFETILADFFPRYAKIITSEQYRNDISEVRIEGHTSSDWTNARSPDDAYINNMRLSQARTRSTLAYVLSLPEVKSQKAWLQSNLTANGLSSSKLVLMPDGSENGERSRRVEFRLITDADARISEILKGVLEAPNVPKSESAQP
ncbi:Outer membrane protein OmpA [Oceanospirillum multiglobuliferum]|uniref:Cell envelope biogenesis protein OmpA n=1 Tax=Oceanospirillum multiglobuliferum TaxID=64969 RepID=A0A1T4RCT9_9GAMM|nr:OmpA family protein [Oceanospirillum multiglobuliferum]OPX55176.1 cell envelope biogenesis protein OmpA [Oceanospirillum multiglobuliferum]SKA13461.1 Outer membrane protein OmpA [Oceanospirillum multiglobuliferum]